MTSTVHLPDGYSLTVTPVFGGFMFKTGGHPGGMSSLLPPSWSIVINSLRDPVASRAEADPSPDLEDVLKGENPFEWESSRYHKPTLNSDFIFLSSINFASSKTVQAKSTSTCQIALILWSTLYWYFHQPEPNNRLTTQESATVPEAARPKGEWVIHLRHEGVFKGRNLLLKLERMGLLTTEETIVGLEDPSGPLAKPKMFVSRRTFWQIDPHIFLFSLAPDMTPKSAPTVPESNSSSRSNSIDNANSKQSATAMSGAPFYTSGHVPSYFPPPPAQWVLLDGWLRHPIRQRPPRQGETFYTRYIPSLQQTISFHVPVLYASSSDAGEESIGKYPRALNVGMSTLDTSNRKGSGFPRSPSSDLEYLHKYLNSPKGQDIWNAGGPLHVQERFLRERLTLTYLFPAIGCWNGKPFGYFEIFWVKEGSVQRPLPTVVDDFDRGLRCLAFSDDDKTPHKTQVWLNSLVHYCLLADNRTQAITIGPRIDDNHYLSILAAAGFYKQGEFTLPQKQGAIVTLKRDNWEAPTL